MGEPGREVREVRKSSREGRADILGEFMRENRSGERGELTVIPGGDVWWDRGPILMGLNLGVLEPAMRTLFPPGGSVTALAFFWLDGEL